MTLEQLMDDFIADALEEGWRFEELRANFERAMRKHAERGKRPATPADACITGQLAAKHLRVWPEEHGFPESMYLIGAMTDTCVHSDYQSGKHAVYHVLLFVDPDGIRIHIGHRPS